MKKNNSHNKKSKKILPAKLSSANNYFVKHWNILKKSFKLDDVIYKLILTDIGFIITLLISYTMVYFLWVRTLLSVPNLLSMFSTGQVPRTVPGEELIRSWNIFVTNLMLILVLIVILYILILSIYGAISHVFMTKNKFSIKLFLNFIYIYLILTLLYALFLIAIFYLSKDIWLSACGVILFTVLYIYSLLIFYLVINGGPLSKVISHGLRSMIRLHHTLVPIILSIIIWLILVVIIQLLFAKLLVVSVPLITLSMIYTLSWTKKYLHHVIHS